MASLTQQPRGDSERRGRLACCSLWGLKEQDTTWWLNNNNIYCLFCLCWVLIAAQAFLQLLQVGATLRSSVQASHCSSFFCRGGALGCTGFSHSRLRAHQLCPGSIVVAQELSCYTAYGILLDQGFNSCLLHWQADSSPLSRQRSPQKY